MQVKCYEKFGYDCVWGFGLSDVAMALGARLSNLEQGWPSIVYHPLADGDGIGSLPTFDIANAELLDYKVEVIKKLREKVGPHVAIFGYAEVPFMVAGELRGLTNFFLDIGLNPKAVTELVDFCFKPCLESAKVIADAGADILWFPLPIASANCISRNHYLQFVTDSNRKFYSTLSEFGCKVVVHTCGKWHDRLDLVVDEGMDGLHLAETDLADFKQKFGDKMTMLGQVHPVDIMLNGTAEQAYDESVKDIKRAAKGGGFLLSADCGIPRETPPENMYAMVRAAIEEGQY